MRHSTTWKRSRSIGLLAVGLLIPLGACSDDDDDSGVDDTATTAGDDTATTAAPDDGGGAAGLTIEGFSFSDVAAAPGATVPVTNADGTAHTVTSDDDAWELLRLDGGSDGEFAAPDDAGSYDFHCDIHPAMTGTLVVE